VYHRRYRPSKTVGTIFVNRIIFLSTPFSYFADSSPLYCLVSLMLRQNQRPQSAHCPFPGCMCTDGGGGPDGVAAYPRKLSMYDSEPLRYAPHSAPPPPLSSSSSGPIPPMRSAYAWDDREREDIGSPQASSSASASMGGSPARKHARTWDHEVSRMSLPYPPPSYHNHTRMPPPLHYRDRDRGPGETIFDLYSYFLWILPNFLLTDDKSY
jgi:hypothetical protein